MFIIELMRSGLNNIDHAVRVANSEVYLWSYSMNTAANM